MFCAAFPNYMTGHGWEWYRDLSVSDRKSWSDLKKQMLEYFCSSTKKWAMQSELFARTQGSDESSSDYIRFMCARVNQLEYSEDMRRALIVQGLRPKLRAFVIKHNPKTVQDIRQLCGLAELVKKIKQEEKEPTPTVNVVTANPRVAQLEEQMSKLIEAVMMVTTKDSRPVTQSAMSVGNRVT